MHALFDEMQQQSDNQGVGEQGEVAEYRVARRRLGRWPEVAWLLQHVEDDDDEGGGGGN